jgi:hypothetical protein
MTTPADLPRRRPVAGRTWAALALFALLAVIMTWPLAANLSSRVPGTATWAFDESTFLWNNWYLQHALLDLHTSPLHSELIWFPLGIDLVLYTFNFTNAALALPLQLVLNLPLASNLTLLLATVLSSLGAYLLAAEALQGDAFAGLWRVQRRSGSQAGGGSQGFFAPWYLAALLAGLIYGFGSNRAVYLALGHYNFATSQWLPFYVLYFLRTLYSPRLKNAVFAGLFFSLAAWTEMTFAAFLALFSLVLLVASWRGIYPHRRALVRLAIAALVALILWSPMLVPVAREFLAGGYGSTGWGESVTLSADLQGLVTPTNLNPLLGPPPAKPLAAPLADGSRPDWQAELRAVEEGQGRFRDINTVFLGYLTLALAVLGAVLPATRRAARAWTWSALVFGVLCLGPLLQIGGRLRFSLDNLLPEGVTFPLPFALLHYVPFFNANRAPNRYSLILMLALAVLAALGAWRLLAWVACRAGPEFRREADSRRTSWRRLPYPALVLGLLLAAGILLEHLAVPLPTTDARIPAVYAQIAAEPGAFSIMQLPLGWRDSYGTLGSEDTQLQYYQTAHGKAMLGGNISRAPAFKLDYFRRIPLFQALTELERYHDVPPAVDAAARAQAGALAALYDLRYLITFPPLPGRYPYFDTWQRVQDYALSVLPVEAQPFWEQDGIRAYRVRQPALPYPFRLDLGTPGNEAYLGAGWDAQLVDQPYGATATWIDGRTAELYLPLAEPISTTLRLALAPLAYPGAQPQSLSISVNGTPVLRNQPLVAGWQTVAAAVPAAVTHRGPNHVRLDFAWAASPREVFPDLASRAVIGSTGVVSPVNLDVHAFSEAFISIFDRTGQETKASAGRRGYNVAVLDPQTGRLLATQGFDTAANRYESDRLVTYLRGIRPGQIVVLATKGDAAAHLTPQAVAAFRSLGSRVATPADLAGQAHALVGIQGATPGSAAEALAPKDGFLRVAGDFRTLSAAVDWAELGP